MLFSRSTIPKGITAVQPFHKEKYLGKWYEIARLDFKFERDLDNTTAEYSVNPDGTIRVVNKGYNTKTKKWKSATGKAKFVGDEKVAMLKVSFFGPFYSGYNVIAIDKDYKYAVVAGKNLKYLWFLSRETTLPEEVKKNYLELARSFGYNTDALVWVNHDK
jgi:apolipoprotein D and lipocalin family protein